MKTTEQQHNARKREMMEKCFDCYAENGLTGTGIKALADACGCTKANLYSYFKNLDELIIESTAYCMEKVEDDFMEMAPTDPKDVVRFVKEVPYWTAKKHGKKYRLMYQIYTHPKYIEHGKKFFEGVNERYTEYAKRLEPKIGIPYTVITPLIFIFVRACVHYAMFEDEYYLNSEYFGDMSKYFEAMENFSVYPYNPSSSQELPIVAQYLTEYLNGTMELDAALEAADADLMNQIGNPYE